MDLGVDDVGIADVSDYQSPNSPDLKSIYPDVKSIVVLAYKELSNCESENMQMAFGGRLDVMEFSRSCNYKLGRFIEREFGVKAMTVSPSYPLEMSYETKGTVGDVSLRHAAKAAGLGNFGRHNLIIHPKLGSKVVFTAILTNLKLASDPDVMEDFCTGCNICVKKCPANALEKEGKTDAMRCLKNSQPYGIASQVKFWSRFAEASVEERQKMVRDVHFWRLYQAGFLGFQYFCFECFKNCPAGEMK
ncbi:Epoxyqueuosine reductase [Natranaerofaba carboxydovora]|nr:Epoxyqueuosine reductase [Natranaerofaba carboxydovora]